ncbi:MAG: hypothetical protein MMC23_006931 [Stictis urceolatum]|nr:hypothetical protein [Stictis urceolata]
MTATASAYDLSSPLPHKQYPDRTLVRRPPSVSSRSAATTTRRHRSHRSHHGGSSYLPQNEFPLFSHTGDVEIAVAADGQEKRYMLHRLILAQCSGFFEASTSEQWSRAQAQAQAQAQLQAGPGGGQGHERRLAVIGEEGSQVSRTRSSSESSPKMFWRYELDWGGDNQDDEVPMLIQKSSLFGADRAPRPPPARSKPAPSSTSSSLFRSISAMQSAIHMPSSKSAPSPDSEIIRDYDNLFRIFYNYAPALDSVNITEAYIQCKTLLNLADMYDALEVVGPRIDHHLLQFQSRLWKQIAKYPPSYLKLGYMSRSRSIFAEALIHVVGQWPLGAPQLRGLPDTVLDLIEDKVADLDDLRARVESRLFRLTLTTRAGERVSPQNSYQDFLAVGLFRHWLADNTTPPPPPVPKSAAQTLAQHRLPPANVHHAQTQTQQLSTRRPATSQSQSRAQDLSPSLPAPLPSTPGRIFRLLGAGGSAYLSHDELKKFLKLRPDEYSRDTLRRFERRVEELKGLAREAVRPLMRNYLELDLGGLGGAGLGYLTCTRVEEGDWPW